MTLKPARLLLAMIAVVAMPAFAQNIAVVNGKAIPKSRGDALAQQVIASGQQPDSPKLRDMIKNELIAQEVMMQEAMKRGFDKDASVKQQLDTARQSIVIQAMAADYVGKNPVSDAEVKAEYDRFKAQAGDKEYHVRHILLGTEAEAKAVIVKIKGGAKFDEVAKTSKDAGTAASGGDLDWASPSSFPPTFSEAFVKLAKGGMTETPVQTQNGWHVIKLDDTRAAKLPTLDEVKPQITDSLRQKKLQAFQEDLMKKAVIK